MNVDGEFVSYHLQDDQTDLAISCYNKELRQKFPNKFKFPALTSIITGNWVVGI